jgi:DNA polymerase III alpha subunit
MRDYLKKTKPSKIEDLIVLNALYRPALQSGWPCWSTAK